MRAHRTLFAEDFDAPNPGVTVLDTPEEPEEIAPRFDAEVVETAREAGFADGYGRGLAQAAQDRAEITARLLVEIADRLQVADVEARAATEASAVAVAELMLAALASLFPALCARYGGAEAAALARALLPALDGEAHITVRVSPHVAVELADALAALDPEMRARVTLLPTDAVPPGDVRITWQDGGARRDGAALWAQLAETFALHGIAMPAATP